MERAKHSGGKECPENGPTQINPPTSGKRVIEQLSPSKRSGEILEETRGCDTVEVTVEDSPTSPLRRMRKLREMRKRIAQSVSEDSDNEVEEMRDESRLLSKEEKLKKKKKKRKMKRKKVKSSVKSSNLSFADNDADKDGDQCDTKQIVEPLVVGLKDEKRIKGTMMSPDTNDRHGKKRKQRLKREKKRRMLIASHEDEMSSGSVDSRSSSSSSRFRVKSMAEMTQRQFERESRRKKRRRRLEEMGRPYPSTSKKKVGFLGEGGRRLPPRILRARAEEARLGPLGMGVHEEKGLRQHMEDRYTLVPLLHSTNEGYRQCAFAGVFDGHGGSKAAAFASKKIAELFKNSAKTKRALRDSVDGVNAKALATALSDTYAQIEREFLEMAREHSSPGSIGNFGVGLGGPGGIREGWIDGTTACCVVVVGTDLIVANVGDSRAVLGRDDDSIRLSTDHKPDLPLERKRVEDAGGSIIFSGCWRVVY